MPSTLHLSASRVFGLLTAAVLVSACLPPEEEDDDDDDTAAETVTMSTTSGGPAGGGFLLDLGVSGQFECSMWLQDCNPGEKCMPYANDGGLSWNGTQCVPIEANAGSPGDACTVVNNGLSGMDSCGAGAMCWNVDEENAGTCVAFCTGTAENPSCEDPATSCSIANDGAVILCLPDCDPLLQDCATTEEACYPVGDAFVCAQDAADAGAGAFGTPCEHINACRAGFACVNAVGVPGCTSLGCCSSFCDLSEPEDACPTGQQCLPYFEEGQAPSPEAEAIGLCLVPS